MKLKDVPYLLGLRPAPRTYGFQVVEFDLPQEGCVEFAQWQHPAETPKRITQQSVDELRTFLSPGDVAIDIGAHSGDTTLPMALAVGKQGCVLALEPNPYVYPVLAHNAQRNRDRTHIIPLMFAATPSDGEYEFEYSDPGYCNGGRHEGIWRWRHAHAFPLKVQGRNLISHIIREVPELWTAIRYIKIDTEGFDLTVLRSISELVDDQRPFVRVEVYRHSTDRHRAELLEFFRERRYEIFLIENEHNYCGEPATLSRILKLRHGDLFCVPVA